MEDQAGRGIWVNEVSHPPSMRLPTQVRSASRGGLNGQDNAGSDQQAYIYSSGANIMAPPSNRYLGVQVLERLQDGQKDTEDSLVLVEPALSIGWGRGTQQREGEMGGGNRPRCIPFQSPYPLPNSARSCPVLCSHLNPPKLPSRVRSPRAASSWAIIKGGPKHELCSPLPGTQCLSQRE